MTLRTSVDIFNREEAVRLLGHLDEHELYHALGQARWSATESYARQMALSEEVTRTKHSIDEITRMNAEYKHEMDMEDRAWRRYEVVRHVMMHKEIINEYVVPMMRLERK